jgi:fructoselysine-6-P-deglycase FrlB-like protein
VAAQVFSYQLTVARGIDPDNPRGLRKVTKTV